jgi:hypothetical protein
MSVETSKHRMRTLYDSEASKANRAEKAARGKPDPLTAVRTRHRDEKGEVAARHRRASLDLEKEFHQEREKDFKIRNGGQPSDQILKREKTATDALRSEQARERNRLEEKHELEMSAAVKHHSGA